MVQKADLKPFSMLGQVAPSLVGAWQNELGSVMIITGQTSAGQLTGTYKSAVSEDGTAATGTLTGYINGDAIGWVVTWAAPLASVTAWSATVLGNGSGTPYLYALWHLSTPVDTPADWWQAFQSGADLFGPLIP